ncbi:hypothetical protein MPTK2_7g03200 [Marchantia polymorpha subsp. ruderalis]
MQAFASPDQCDDELFLSDDSPVESDEEGEEHVWTLQPESPDTTQSRGEAKCSTFEPCRRVAMDKVTEATCSGFSVDGSWLAVGTRRGPVQIHSVGDGRLAFSLDVLRGGLKRWPCTALCIRPSTPGDPSYNVLLSCDLSGQIHYWHMTSGMHLGTSKEHDNSIYTIDYHPAGVKYATSGSDCKVRVYDSSTTVLLQTLSGGNGATTAGHSNRVFAVKWHPVDANIALSGGWDNTIQIWDLRDGHSVRSIYGPKVCGDAIDIRDAGNVILSGSWRGSKQLQEWDFGSGQLLRDISWPTGKEQTCRVYAAKYGRGVSQGLFVAGGSGSNETCLFSVNTGQMVARLPDDDKATYSISLSTDGSHMAATAGDTVKIVDLKAELSAPREQESRSDEQSSPSKTRQVSRTNGDLRGERKTKLQPLGSRAFRHVGTVAASMKTRFPGRSSSKVDHQPVPSSRAFAAALPKFNVKPII